MAKNLGREFATMSEDERRKFAREKEGELGRQYGSLREEIAIPTVGMA